MSLILKPTYLLCQNGRSNKFYVGVEFDGAEGVTGYGPAGGNAKGTWTLLSASEVGQKVREKSTKDYKFCRVNDIPRAAIAEMLASVADHFKGRQASMKSNGTIEVDDAGGAPAAPPPKAPKRSRGKDNIHIWL